MTVEPSWSTARPRGPLNIAAKRSPSAEPAAPLPARVSTTRCLPMASSDKGVRAERTAGDRGADFRVAGVGDGVGEGVGDADSLLARTRSFSMAQEPQASLKGLLDLSSSTIVLTWSPLRQLATRSVGARRTRSPTARRRREGGGAGAEEGGGEGAGASEIRRTRLLLVSATRMPPSASTAMP